MENSIQKKTDKKVNPCCNCCLFECRNKTTSFGLFGQVQPLCGCFRNKTYFIYSKLQKLFDMKCILGPFWLKRILKQCVF